MAVLVFIYVDVHRYAFVYETSRIPHTLTTSRSSFSDIPIEVLFISKNHRNARQSESTYGSTKWTLIATLNFSKASSENRDRLRRIQTL